MNLTDFLLARIAEDEEELAGARISDSPEWWMPSMWSRERAEAECEAKRRIASMAAEQLDKPSGTELLQLLALPYVDHDDYQEEWRP